MKDKSSFRHLQNTNLYTPRPYQKEGLDAVEKEYNRGNNRQLVAWATGSGKAQPYDEPVLTPNGFVHMGSISVGDYVIGSDGMPKQVLQVHEQGDKDVYSVKFNDETTVRATLDHRWIVQTKSQAYYERKNGVKNRTVKTTKNFINDESKWQVPTPSPIDFKAKDLPIHPYVLGVLIAEGCRIILPVVMLYADEEIFCVDSSSAL